MLRSRFQWAFAAVLSAGLLLPHAAAAQFATGQKFLGAHIGLSGVGSTAAIGVNGEVAYNRNISIGAWADTWSYGDNFAFQGGSAEWNVRYIAVAGTGAYHFPIESQPKLDPFVGAAVGYYVVNTSQKGTFIGDYRRLRRILPDAGRGLQAVVDARDHGRRPLSAAAAVSASSAR
jgi:hypothetical protein